MTTFRVGGVPLMSKVGIYKGRNRCLQGATNFLFFYILFVLGLSGKESTFPIAALLVLSFVFVARTVWITH